MDALPGAKFTGRARWLRPAIYIDSLAVFIIDIVTPPDILPFGVFYMPLVASVLLHRNPRAEWLLAAIACAMIVIGAFVPSIDPDTPGLAVDRGLSMGLVLGTAAYVRYVRSMKHRLERRTTVQAMADQAILEALTDFPQL